jgi:hypothetical protein
MPLNGQPEESVVLAAIAGMKGGVEDAIEGRFLIQRTGAKIKIYFQASKEEPNRAMSQTNARRNDPVFDFAAPRQPDQWKRTEVYSDGGSTWGAVITAQISIYESPMPLNRERCAIDLDVKGVLSVSVEAGKAVTIGINFDPMPEQALYRSRQCTSIQAAPFPDELSISWDLP